MNLTENLNIENKKHLLQFLPKKLEFLTKNKKISFQGKNLKTDYLIDIIHKMISKYYFSNKTKVNLSSQILRYWYGTFYNYYINYLLRNQFIFKISNYCNDKKCITYKLNTELLNQPIIRYKNTNKFLLKKWKEQFLQREVEQINDQNVIDPWVKKKLVEDLSYVEINFDEAYKTIEEEYNNNELTFDGFRKNLFSIESIKDRTLFYTEDRYGRLHTNFTVLKKVIRENFIKIDGEESEELDINNSQPLFLAILMKEKGIENDPYYQDEFETFFNDIKESRIYSRIAEKGNYNRKQCKALIFTVFFGKNRFGDANDIFKSIYPKMFEWIKSYKYSHNDYSALAHVLQRKESNVIFDKICHKIKKDHPEIRLFTVHDSVYFPKKYRSQIRKIFYNYVDILFA